jgi:hypothetical protein
MLYAFVVARIEGYSRVLYAAIASWIICSRGSMLEVVVVGIQEEARGSGWFEG